MLEAVIFDMDGVIIDSEPLHYVVNKDIFKNMNLDIKDEEYSTLIGRTNIEIWNYIIKKYKVDGTVEELIKYQLVENIKYLKEHPEKPIPGIFELLQELKNNNIKIGLASSSPLEYIELVITSFGIDKFFEVVVSGENTKKSKPDPDIYIYTVGLMKVPPENCAVIEDSHNGVLAAIGAGMKCIGFQNLNSGNQDISSADKIVSQIKEIKFADLLSIF